MQYKFSILCFFFLMFVCKPVSAQMDDGSYQGFPVVKGKDQPDNIISIYVLSLGNDLTMFNEAGTKKPLQGTYHIILNRNKYNIGNFKKGLAHGDWEEHFYGKLYQKCTFKDGKYDGKVYIYGIQGSDNKYPDIITFKDGLYQHYISYHSENGQLEEERFYDENGKHHGEVTTYDKDGNIIRIQNYQHGELHGTQMIIEDRGYKETTEYADGKRNGEYSRLYPNGNVYSKGKYENGKKNGLWVNGDENGDIKSEENYLNDKLDGVSRQYYSGNVLHRIEEYSAGMLNGKRITYTENPHQILRESTYVNGGENGPFKQYYKGLLWKEGVYKNGQVAYEKEYDKGKLRTVKSLDADGSLVKIEEYNTTGKKTYKNQTYKKHSSIKLKENASGVVDIEVE